MRHIFAAQNVVLTARFSTCDRCKALNIAKTSSADSDASWWGMEIIIANPSFKITNWREYNIKVDTSKEDLDECQS